MWVALYYLMAFVIFVIVVCNLLLNVTKRRFFKFASIQSEVGQALLEQYKVPTNINSVIYIEQGKVYVESTAALNITRHLDGLWPVFYVLIVIPPCIRNTAYQLFAKNRYRLFGQKQACLLPSPSQRERFLEQR